MDFSTWNWLNQSDLTQIDDGVRIEAPPHTDFFRPPSRFSGEGIPAEPAASAPYLYTEVEGDFVLRARVTHPFTDTYDAATLMVMATDDVWGKACFEGTDFGTRAVVSVVTRGVSDDANGPDVDGDEVWLQVARVGDAFAFHYSLTGDDWRMMRYFTMPVRASVRVGLVAQSPSGSGGPRDFRAVSLEQRTVNVRTGV